MNLLITPAPCSPEAAGLDPLTDEGKAYQAKIDKWRCTGTPAKAERFVDEFCSACPNRLADFCESQGHFVNFDGVTVIADGIFGGYTEAERAARGVRHFDPVEG